MIRGKRKYSGIIVVAGFFHTDKLGALQHGVIIHFCDDEQHDVSVVIIA